MNHTAIRQLLGAFALDAVDEDERDLVERHLPTCSTCRDEVTVHLEVAGMLSVAWEPAPDGVWDRIAGSLEEAPPAMSFGNGNVVPMQRPRRNIGYRVAAAVAVAAAAVIGVMGAKLVDTDRELNQVLNVLEADEHDRAVNAAAARPDATHVRLASSDESLSARAVLLPDGTGYLVSSNLPELPADRTYQMWAVVEGSAISVGVLGPSPDKAVFRAAGPVSALAITEEVAGGVITSSQDPKVLGAI